MEKMPFSSTILQIFTGASLHGGPVLSAMNITEMTTAKSLPTQNLHLARRHGRGKQKYTKMLYIMLEGIKCCRKIQQSKMGSHRECQDMVKSSRKGEMFKDSGESLTFSLNSIKIFSTYIWTIGGLSSIPSQPNLSLLFLTLVNVIYQTKILVLFFPCSCSIRL